MTINYAPSSQLEQNPKLGFYQVGDKTFFSKIQALTESTRTGIFPKWNFNRDIYSKIDWTVEPEVDIRELYRLRAVQLRDRYDYIRIEASGGGDSTTAIFSFLLNGIHLDEIVFRYPKAGSDKFGPDAGNSRCENTLSEYEFAMRPLLNWVSVNHPKVKITVHDYSQDMLNDTVNDESWVRSANEILQPAHVTKFPVLGTIEHKIFADKGKKICVLYGIDKPKMCIKDGAWYLYFLDFQANYANPDIGHYDNITNEYFFWSPDLPEISVKQAHLIVNWFNEPSNSHMQFLARWPNHSVSQRTSYEALIKPLIYPDYDPMTFQVSKPSNNFYAEMDHWFFASFQETRLYSKWKAGLDYVSSKIDPKFFNKEFGRNVGFVGFLSDFYYLGPAVNNSKNLPHMAQELADRF